MSCCLLCTPKVCHLLKCRQNPARWTQICYTFSFTDKKIGGLGMPWKVVCHIVEQSDRGDRGRFSSFLRVFKYKIRHSRYHWGYGFRIKLKPSTKNKNSIMLILLVEGLKKVDFFKKVIMIKYLKIRGTFSS